MRVTMEDLIPIASKLQDVLGAVGQSKQLDLPQITVVGGQSSGKSSVLESLVGRSFLPRGTGIVTRRPLVLQLYNTRDNGAVKSSSKKSSSSRKKDENPTPASEGNNDKDAEWGEFLHKPGKKFYDFNQIREEIVRETERLTGRNKGIDDAPIGLKIYSPHVLSLTVVDLPGIAKVPVGDQPKDIEHQIRRMVLKYITNPNAIILAVSAANADLANSDALQLAQQVDPNGHRTVGVLTKVDLMDPGTDCGDILMNMVIPLRRGYIAVVNRGQADIVNDSSIREGLKKEEAFFKSHPVYSRDRGLLTKCGTSRLSKMMNGMLLHHIRDCLPDLKQRISSMQNDVNQELEALGSSAPPNSRSNRGAALLKILSKFSTNFGSLLSGAGCKDLEKAKRTGQIPAATNAQIPPELEGGSRIYFVFTDIFAASLKGVGAFDGLSDDEVRIVIRNANGTRPALFVPEMSFDILVRRQISQLENPGIQCVDMVYEELHRVALQCAPGELTRYPVLRDRLNEVVSSLLRRCLAPTQMMVQNMIKVELSYINTAHPDFIGGSLAVAKLMKKVGKDGDDQRKKSIIQKTTRGLTSPTSNAQRADDDFADATENQAPDDHLDEEVFRDSTDAASNAGNGIMNYIFRSESGTNGGSSKAPTKQSKKNEGPPATVQFNPPPVGNSIQAVAANAIANTPMSDRERVEMEVIKTLVESYYSIIRKQFTDVVPKTIMYMLVNHVKDTLQNELVSELYRDAEIGQLLQEAEDVASRRQTCTEMKELLSQALDIVTEVRDFNSM